MATANGVSAQLGRGSRQESLWASGEFLFLNEPDGLFQLDSLVVMGSCFGGDWKVKESPGYSTGMPDFEAWLLCLTFVPNLTFGQPHGPSESRLPHL